MAIRVAYHINVPGKDIQCSLLFYLELIPKVLLPPLLKEIIDVENQGSNTRLLCPPFYRLSATTWHALSGSNQQHTRASR